jgi:hypothetical protein
MSKFNQAQPQHRQFAAGKGGNPNVQEYFDLHVRGCGYMSRVRWVEVKGKGRKSEPFLACAINAMHGPVDQPNYSYMDLRVSGEDAISVVSSLMEAVDAKRKVFVAFRVGDIYAHPYERAIRNERGRETGSFEPAAVIKGRLLLITCAKIDGEVVYLLDDDGTNEQSESAVSQNADDAHEGHQQAPQGTDESDEELDDDHQQDSGEVQDNQQRPQRLGRVEGGNRFSGRSNVSQGRFQQRQPDAPASNRMRSRVANRNGTGR